MTQIYIHTLKIISKVKYTLENYAKNNGKVNTIKVLERLLEK